MKKVLCPIDCSDGSKIALDYALTLARQLGAEVHVLHAWQVGYHLRPDLSVWMEAEGERPLGEVVADEARADAERFLATLGADARAALRVHLVEGEPARTITQVAARDHFDLIVMGTHGRTGLAHLALGSVAERVVRHAPCPVLTVRMPSRGAT